jgi:hypothetical protein
MKPGATDFAAPAAPAHSAQECSEWPATWEELPLCSLELTSGVVQSDG